MWTELEKGKVGLNEGVPTTESSQPPKTRSPAEKGRITAIGKAGVHPATPRIGNPVQLVLLASLVLIVAAFIAAPGSTWLLPLSWLAFAFSVALAKRTDALRRTALSPLNLLLAVVVCEGLVIPAWLLETNQTILFGTDLRTSFAAASSLTALAGIAAVAGWSLAPRRTARRMLPGSCPLSPPVVASVLVLLSILLLFRVRLYGLDTWAVDLGIEQKLAAASGDGYIDYAPQYVTGFCAYILANGRYRWLWKPCGLLALVLLVVQFASGIRYTFITSGLLLAVVVGGRGLPWARMKKRFGVVTAVAGLCFCLLIIGLLGNLRSGRSATDGTRRAAASSFEVFLPLAALVQADLPLRYGDTYSYILIQPIPRSFWSAKPPPPIVELIAEFSDPTEGRALPMWGEAYANFGVIGVIGVMGIFGAVLRRLSSSALSARTMAPIQLFAVGLALGLIPQWLLRGYVVQSIHNSLAFAVVPIGMSSWRDAS